MTVTTAPLCFAQKPGEQFTHFFNFSLGFGTLADIAATVAPTQIKTTGEAGEFVASIFYRTPEGVVAFLAGEMDGVEHSLSGFWVARDEVTGPCDLWPAGKTPPPLVIGQVRLGMTLSEFKRVIDRPITWADGWVMVAFESARKLLPEKLARLPSSEVQGMMKQGQMQDHIEIIVSVSARFSKGHL